MSRHLPFDGSGSVDDAHADEDVDLQAGVEAYATDDGVVFYAADNPLAWVETSRPIGLRDAR